MKGIDEGRGGWGPLEAENFRKSLRRERDLRKYSELEGKNLRDRGRALGAR